MSHGVKYFLWRNGRPRWIPGEYVRRRGGKGRDLKDAMGAWLPLDEARAAAAEINKAFGIFAEAARPAAAPPAGRSGFVYFVLVGKHIKIGFSVRPFVRLQSLDTGFSQPIALYVTVPGTRQDEHRVHQELAAHRVKGEWFEANHHVMKCIVRCVRHRRIAGGTERKQNAAASREA